MRPEDAWIVCAMGGVDTVVYAGGRGQSSVGLRRGDAFLGGIHVLPDRRR